MADHRLTRCLYGEKARSTWMEGSHSWLPEDRDRLFTKAERESDAFKAKIERESFQARKLGSYGRMATWISYVPIPWQQKALVSWVWGIQSKEGDCCRSIGEFAKLLNCERKRVAHQLKKLVEAGYLDKKRNGAREPSTYSVNEANCIEAAKANGWDPCCGYEWDPWFGYGWIDLDGN